MLDTGCSCSANHSATNILSALEQVGKAHALWAFAAEPDDCSCTLNSQNALSVPDVLQSW